MEMECARWEDEYTMRGRLGLRGNVSLHVPFPFIKMPAARLWLAAATYFGRIRSLAHSLSCPKLEKRVLLPPGATWRPGSRRPGQYGKVQLDA